jgi:hypothetical protein
MAGQSSQDLFKQVVDGVTSKVDEYAQGIANRLGSPLSGQQLTQDQAVQRWNFSPLGSTDQADAAYHQLVAQGTPPGQALSQVYPMRQLLLQGQDLDASIARAKQIAGWAADASGTKPAEPFEGSTMPLALMQQAQQSAAPPLPAAPAPPLGPQAPPLLPAPAAGPGIPAMASGGVVTQPTLAVIGEAGPEAVVPLQGQPGPSAVLTTAGADPNASPDQVGQYIQQAAIARGIDPGTAIQVALHEGFAQGQPAARGTFATGSSWWPFQLHYGGPGYEQYGNVAGLGNDFTAQTGWQPGDPRAWQAATDFALDTALQRGWYPTFYGSVPAGVAPRQGLPTPAPAQRAA